MSRLKFKSSTFRSRALRIARPFVPVDYPYRVDTFYAMGVVAELGRLAIGAWSPVGIGGGYIAAGAYGGAVDTFNVTNSPSLQLVSFDIQRSKLSVVSELPIHEKFASLDWSIPSRSFPAGLIAGGLNDGTVRVWDAASVIRSGKSGDDPNKGVVFGEKSSQTKHSGAVRALSFNPTIPTRLATGSADGNVLVWDLSNPSAGASVRHPAGQSTSNAGSKEEVTAVSWNFKVPQVLASATTSGVMNVWDLKKSKCVISIRNPRGRLRCSSLAWHPDIATQIIVTCDEDESTGALLWDMRNANAPIMTYTHHSPKGVAACSWSTHDSDMLLTSSKDARTIVASVSSGEIISEAPQAANWNFDVKWSPRIPGLYLSSSYDGRLTVNSIMTATTGLSVSSETADALAESFGEMVGGFQTGVGVQSPRATESQRVIYNLARPPKWMRKAASISFSFGGWRASVCSKDGCNVNIEPFHDSFPSLAGSSLKLDDMLVSLTSEDPSPAQQWCSEASARAETPKEKLAWDAIEILFQTDSRRKLLTYLGFDLPPPDAGDIIEMPVYGLQRSAPLAVPVRPTPQSEVDEPTPKQDGAPESDVITNGVGGLNLDGPAPWETDIGVDATNPQDSILDGDDTANGGPEGLGDGQIGKGALKGDVSQRSSFAGKSVEEIELLIRRGVVVGDFLTAVEASLHIGRTADALIIAHAGGPRLWEYAQTEYLSKASLSSSSSIVGAIAGPQSKMDDYIRQTAESGKESWKEALAVLLTYCPADDLMGACTALGQRLLVKGSHGPALFCFICGNDTRMATSTWMRERPTVSKATSAMMSDRLEHLVALVKKVRILTAASLLGLGEREIGAVRSLDEVSGSVLCEFGALLTAGGDAALAVTYLSNLDPSYNCVYGTAEDLQAKAAESLAAVDSATVMSSEIVSPGNGQGYNHYNAYEHGYSSTPGMYPDTSYGNTNAHGVGAAPPPPPSNSWSTQAPPVPTAPYSNTPLSPTHSAVSRTLPPQALSPLRPSTAYSAHAPAPERSAYDPSAAYAAAPAYNPSAYQQPPLPPAPGSNYALAAASGAQLGGAAPTTPTAPVPAQFPAAAPPSVPPVPMNGTGYGMQAPQPTPMGTTFNAPAHQLEPSPPPPPPPADDGAPPPMPYHANARPGSGSSLPPSAEVAVAQARRTKPLSSSGTPGGPPRRSPSTCSSLSALGIETALLEKADVSKVPADQQVIVKSLRGSYTYARSLSEVPRYRKKIEDISKRLGRLLAALNNGLLEQAIVDLLISFGKAVEKGNYDEASVIVSKLTKQYWDSNSQWIQGLKRLIDCVLTGR